MQGQGQGQGQSLQGPGQGQELDLQGQGQGLTSLTLTSCLPASFGDERSPNVEVIRRWTGTRTTICHHTVVYTELESTKHHHEAVYSQAVYGWNHVFIGLEDWSAEDSVDHNCGLRARPGGLARQVRGPRDVFTADRQTDSFRIMCDIHWQLCRTTTTAVSRVHVAADTQPVQRKKTVEPVGHTIEHIPPLPMDQQYPPLKETNHWYTIDHYSSRLGEENGR